MGRGDLIQVAAGLQAEQVRVAPVLRAPCREGERHEVSRRIEADRAVVVGCARPRPVVTERRRAEERFRLRFRSATETLENPLRLREIRRDIARLKTVLRARELAAETAQR